MTAAPIPAVIRRQAEQILGSKAAARRWFAKPNRALGGTRPCDAAKTPKGAADVAAVLGRIEHGVYS